MRCNGCLRGYILQRPANIIRKLVVTWLPASVVRAADSEMNQEEFLNLCTFLALTHDIGKLTPVFQSSISEQFQELRTRSEESGLLLYRMKSLLSAGKSPHALAGESILLDFGCPPSVAVVVGAHHGKPQEIKYDIENQTRYYEENYYGCKGKDSEQGKLWGGSQTGMAPIFFGNIRIHICRRIAAVEYGGTDVVNRTSDYG